VHRPATHHPARPLDRASGSVSVAAPRSSAQRHPVEHLDRLADFAASTHRTLLLLSSAQNARKETRTWLKRSLSDVLKEGFAIGGIEVPVQLRSRNLEYRTRICFIQQAIDLALFRALMCRYESDVVPRADQLLEGDLDGR
jgi:hypothetical protein